MANSDEQIRIDVRQALNDIAQLKGGLSDLRNEAVKTGKASQSAFGAEGALKEAQAVESLRKRYQEIVGAVGTLKTALKNAYDPRAIVAYTGALAKLEAAQKKIETGAKAAGVALESAGKKGSLAADVIGQAFGAIGKATIIVALIQSVYELAKAGLELSNNYSKAQKQFEAFLGSTEKANQTLGALTDFSFSKFLNTQEVLDAGKSLLAFGEASGNLVPVLGRIADVSAATGKNFGELAIIYGKARAAGVLYAEDINQLVDAGIPIIGEFAKQMGVSTDQVKKLASEGKIKFEELQLAMFNLTAEGGRFSKQAEAQATTLPGLWASLTNRIKPLIKDLGDTLSFYAKGFVSDIGRLLDLLGIADKAAGKGVKSIDQLKAIRDSAGKAQAIDNNSTTRAALEKANDDLLAAGRDFNEKQTEQRQDAQILIDAADKARNQKSADQLKKEKANYEKRLKDQEDHNKKLAELQLQKLDPKGEAFAIAKENLRFEDQKKEFKKFGLDIEEIEILHQANLFNIRIDFENKRVSDAQESAKRLADLYNQGVKETEDAEKKRTDSIQKELETQRDLGTARINVQEEIGKGVIIALQKSGADEKAIKEAQRQLDIEVQKARLENELKFQLSFLEQTKSGDTARLDSTLAEIDRLKAAIANATADAAPNPDKKGKQGGLLESLFPKLDDGELKAILAAIGTIKDSVISALQDISAARIEAADKQLELAGKEKDAAQAAYDKQKELDDQGYSSSLEIAAAELALAKDKEDKALKIKQDAQKKQVQLDTAIQLSSLITSSANIYKSLSGLGPVGIALAAVTIAAMFVAFAAARSRAAKAVKLRAGGQIDENGVMQGPSHDEGGVDFEMEGGEFLHSDGRRLAVVNKRSTRSEFDLLAAINRNDDKAKDRWALNRVAVLNRGGYGSGIMVVGGDDKQAHGLLRQIRDKKSAQAETWTENGYRVTRRGNHTERVKIKSQ